VTSWSAGATRASVAAPHAGFYGEHAGAVRSLRFSGSATTRTDDVVREFVMGTGRSAADPHGVVADHLHRHIAEIPRVQVTAAALGFGECIGTGEGAVGVDRPGLRIDDEHDVGVAAVEGLGAVEALGSLGSGPGASDARRTRWRW